MVCVCVHVFVRACVRVLVLAALGLNFFCGGGGFAVAVNAFSLISKRTAPERREFSLSVASVADTFGISLVRFMGVKRACETRKVPALPLGLCTFASA